MKHDLHRRIVLGLVARSAKNVVHLANVCGFVGTDIEFQSRRDASGGSRDYAFVGIAGDGTVLKGNINVEG